MKKYTILITEDENTNMIKIDRENRGFRVLELLGLLDYIRMDIQKQITDKEFAEKNIEHKSAVVDKEEEDDQV